MKKAARMSAKDLLLVITGEGAFYGRGNHFSNDVGINLKQPVRIEVLKTVYISSVSIMPVYIHYSIVHIRTREVTVIKLGWLKSQF